MSDAIKGGCQCGAVRYEISEPLHNVSHCHCSMCRKQHGALFVSFGTTAVTHLSVDGEDSLSSYESSASLTRQFCSNCGGQVLIRAEDNPDNVFVALGSLDAGQSPGHTGGERHIFWESKVSWYDPSDDLPKMTGYGE